MGSAQKGGCDVVALSIHDTGVPIKKIGTISTIKFSGNPRGRQTTELLRTQRNPVNVRRKFGTAFGS